jgi:hypothetical protein
MSISHHFNGHLAVLDREALIIRVYNGYEGDLDFAPQVRADSQTHRTYARWTLGNDGSNEGQVYQQNLAFLTAVGVPQHAQRYIASNFIRYAPFVGLDDAYDVLARDSAPASLPAPVAEIPLAVEDPNAPPPKPPLPFE